MNYFKKNYVDKGWIQIKINKKLHKELFPLRKLKWYKKPEYWVHPKSGRGNIIWLKPLTYKAVVMIGFPVFLLLFGLWNIKDAIKEYKELFNQKKYGSFYTDSFSINILPNGLKYETMGDKCD